MAQSNVLTLPVVSSGEASRPVAGRPTTAAPAVTPAQGIAAAWWLIQGMVWGAVGGGTVSAIVIGFALFLRWLMNGG